MRMSSRLRVAVVAAAVPMGVAGVAGSTTDVSTAAPSPSASADRQGSRPAPDR